MSPFSHLPSRRPLAKNIAETTASLSVVLLCCMVLGLLLFPTLGFLFANAETTGNPQPAAGPAIGIDLGTTYSVVGVVKNGAVEIIPNSQGNRITPSYVAYPVNPPSFSSDGGGSGLLVGEAAKATTAAGFQQDFVPIFDAKRLIGRTFSDVQKHAHEFPFKLVRGPGDRVGIEVPSVSPTGAGPTASSSGQHDTAVVAPETISAAVLRELKRDAENYLGTEVRQAVITVPAYFNDAQRQATKDAARIAGLDVLRMINEPTAAAIAYGLDGGGRKKGEKDEDRNVLVFDLGGGTFDVSVLTLDAGSGVFEVLATSGDTRLGGEDFDHRVLEWVLKEKLGLPQRVIQSREAETLSAFSQLRRSIEAAKRRLSTAVSAEIEVPAQLSRLSENRSTSDVAELDDKTVKITLTRATFEKLNRELFQKTLKAVRSALADADVSKQDIDEVVLVGGSTRIPKVQQLVREFFGENEKGAASKVRADAVNPDEAVAYGAAIQACTLSPSHMDCGKFQHHLVLDVSPLTLGIETAGGVMTSLIKRNTVVPTKKQQVFLERAKWVKRAKVPHIPTPYVCGTMAIATMRTHTYGA